MRLYNIVKPTFWNGRTGRQIKNCGSDSQLVALYLFTGPLANAIGFYHLPFGVLRKHVALSETRIRKSLQDLTHLRFCAHDLADNPQATEVVWVHEMAYHQLGALTRHDRLVKVVAGLYDMVPPNPFLEQFYDRYHRLLLLPHRRVAPHLKEPPNDSPYHSQVLSSGVSSEVGRTTKNNVPVTASRARGNGEGPPFDEWLRDLACAYPQQRVTSGYLTEHGFHEAITGDGRDPRLVFDEMLDNLENQKAGHEWRVKRMIPRLDRWLREGLWKQRHDAVPPSTLVSERTLNTHIAGDAFVKGGGRED